MLLVGNGKIITRDDAGSIMDNGTVAIEGKEIVEVGSTEALKAKYPGARFIDANGKLIMPGFINTHMHYYSTFARGMANDSPPARCFTDILKGLWWRLDRKLTQEDVYYSAIVPMIDQIKCGVTTVFDHHASAYSVKGSLFTIADAARKAGLRSNLCYETSDRDGALIAEEGIRENAEFIKYCNEQDDDMLKGLFGLHASMTVSKETINKCLEAIDGLDSGFHVHCAEGIEDVEDAKSKYGTGVIERWYKDGVLGEKTIAVHCIHLSDEEMDMLKETKSMVVNNPQSNMGNAVGASPVLKMAEKGILLGLGTDGYTADVLESLKVGGIIQRHVNQDSTVAWGEFPQMLFKGNRTIAERFIKRSVGVIQPGALADIIIVDYNSPTPINSSNIDGHIFFGVTGRQVDTTIVNGRVLMEHRVLTELDEEQIMARSRELAAEVWKRF